MASSRCFTREGEEEEEEEEDPPPRSATTDTTASSSSSSSSSSSLFLASLLQKSYVSCKKFQFSKRVHAVKNAIFARRLMTINVEDERNENDEILLLVGVTLLGERFDLNDYDNNNNNNDGGYERLKARVDSLFFATYVHDFPPIESKKMFLLRSNNNDDASHDEDRKNSKNQTTTTNNRNNNNNSAFFLATMRAKSIDFVADKLGGYTTDCGWGCAPRSAQMLFGEALRRGRWNRRRRRRRSGEGNEIEEEEEKAMRKEIVDMFTDDVDEEENENGKAKNVFGLRRVYEGDEDEKTNALCPGQWLAPSEICKRYGKMVNALDSSSFKSVRVRCLVLGDGCGGGVPEFYPERVRKEMEAHPDKDVLILVPLRCGASDTINPRYVKSLQKFLSARECVGIVGGKKSASYYIVGFTSNKNSSKTKSDKSSRSNDDSFSGNRAKEREEKDNEEEEEDSKAIYLDPHVAKAYESPRERYRDETTESAFYASFFGSASEHGILYTPFRALDPSLVVGFLVENDTNRDDITDERRAPFSSLNSFVDVLTKIERESGSTPLVTVVRKDDANPSASKVSKKTTSSGSVSSSKRTAETKKTGDENDWEIIDSPSEEEEEEEEEEENDLY